MLIRTCFLDIFDSDFDESSDEDGGNDEQVHRI